MLPMLARSFGGGVQEARAKGYGEGQQVLLGLANAATEYFSERLFSGTQGDGSFVFRKLCRGCRPLRSWSVPIFYLRIGNFLKIIRCTIVLTGS